MLQKILNTNPEQRFTIEQIRQHPWYKKESILTDPLPTFDHTNTINDNNEPINPSILQEMQNAGYNIDESLESIKEKKHDHNYAAYHLLIQRRLQQSAEGTISKIQLTNKTKSDHINLSKHQNEIVNHSPMISQMNSHNPHIKETFHNNINKSLLNNIISYV